MIYTKKQSVIILHIITILTVFSVSEIKAQENEIDTIIKDVSVDTQKGAIFGYTYTMKFSYTRKASLGFGRKFTRLYEAIIPSRFSLKKTYGHPLLLVYDSERTLTINDVESMRTKLVEEIERAENEAEASPTTPSDSNDGGYWTMSFKPSSKAVKIDLIKLLESSRFSDMKKSESNGRKIISMDFSPRLDAKLSDSLSYLSKIEGKIWIDEIDKRIIKIEGYPLGTSSSVKELPAVEREQKLVFLFAQKRVAEGYWFPDYVVVDFTKTPELFDPVKIEFRFDKYSKFSTEVKASSIEKPIDTDTVKKPEKDQKDNQQKDNQQKDNQQKDQ